jgi:hypothetical protein
MKRLAVMFLMVAGGSTGCGRIFNAGDQGSTGDGLTNGAPCGPTTCTGSEVCCNESCGICVPPGGFCPAIACANGGGAGGGGAGGSGGGGHQCGPVVCTLACQYGYEHDANGCELCVCKPPPDAGVVRQCGNTTCGSNEICCNPSCGICAPMGGVCPAVTCGGTGGGSGGAGGGGTGGSGGGGHQCGPVVCTLACQYGYEHDSNGCEICVCKPPPADAGTGRACGPVTCGSNEICCDASCGICAPMGGVCPAVACTDAGHPPPHDGGASQPCGFNSCGPGTECCNPSCGICVPTGGACSQVLCAPCAPVTCTLACPQGYQRNANGCEICACAPPPPTCGNVTCNSGLECCNSSCGICTPPGGACVQLACN